MKKCLYITYLISQSQDEKLDFKQRLALRLHVLMCRKCRRYQQQLHIIQKNIKRL